MAIRDDQLNRKERVLDDALSASVTLFFFLALVKK